MPSWFAQVDEAQAAEITGERRPTAQGDGLADQRFVDQATEMGTHGDSEDAGARHRAAAD